MTEETKKPNKFGESLQEWWDSDACKQLQEASEESVQKAVIEILGDFYYARDILPLKTSNEKSFLIKKTVKNKTFKLKFDIVLDVLNTKIEERDNLLSARANKEHNAKIDELIAEKQDANLKGKTIKQLENMKK